MVSVRKWRPQDKGAVTSTAAKGPARVVLEDAVSNEPALVRVVHIGEEVVGAFVLRDLKGGVEEVSGLHLTSEGSSAGAERAALEYVVSAARFAHKSAVEVIAPSNSGEARHLVELGFHKVGDMDGSLVRYRFELRAAKGKRA